MKRIMYASDCCNETDRKDIEEIIAVSKKNNSENDIRGLLVVLPKHFFQIIEGPIIQVERLMEKIRLDTRHTNIMSLIAEPIPDYEYCVWDFVSYESNEEFQDAFWVLSQFAVTPHFEGDHVRGISMILKGMSVA